MLIYDLPKIMRRIVRGKRGRSKALANANSDGSLGVKQAVFRDFVLKASASAGCELPDRASYKRRSAFGPRSETSVTSLKLLAFRHLDR